MGFMIATIGDTRQLLKCSYLLIQMTLGWHLSLWSIAVRGRPAFRTDELVIFIGDLELKLTCARHHIAYYKMISFVNSSQWLQ